MLERFTGEDGRRRLADALTAQSLVHGDRSLAEAMADVVELLDFPADSVFIQQDAFDSDVYFILAGRVGIEVNGFEVASREAGTHVGEMAAIDPTGSRSATVRALVPTLAAKLSEPQLDALAREHPRLWRRFAVELANRLRQRSKFIRVPNERPHLFIGSSAEMLPVATAIQAGLSHDDIRTQVWTDGVFQASEYTLKSLIEVAEASDFGVLVLGADDLVTRRGKELSAPRDNVIFELGLFVGSVGKDRTYIVKAGGSDLSLPTDLLGITPIEYSRKDDIPIANRIAPVCTQIRSLISALGVK